MEELLLQRVLHIDLTAEELEVDVAQDLKVRSVQTPFPLLMSATYFPIPGD